MYHKPDIANVEIIDGPMIWHNSHYTRFSKPRRVPEYRIQRITFVDGTIEFRRLPSTAKVN